MRNGYLNRQLQLLRHLIARTNTATQEISMQEHWAKYLCVVAAGFVETGLQTIYSDFSERRTPRQVARYVSRRLGNVTNPNAQRFIQVAGDFSGEWRRELEEYLNSDDALRKHALDSLMANRNQISHGKTSGVTVSRVTDYLDRCVEVLEFIEDQCDGIPRR